ncbi:hypothetical protein KV205_06320 [Streptomyces sp. SKN60]|uniref:hypothetical protein n=1 Tax=Streptomyces sp. SKN60 TaxID=2855506 RepID=UPI00224513D5|nr:hypothetical protein [Streptomyces sp. SKN60]MCX2180146.1 hypothetical protein [Streptomyces sp. SKN60]
MELDEFVKEELARHDWAALGCGCGDNAEHIPLLFETILTAETEQELRGYSIDGHVVWDGDVFACTPPAVGVVMAALSGEPSALARDRLVYALWRIATAEFAPAEIIEQVRTAVTEGLWPLVRIGLTGRPPVAETVAEVFECLDVDGERAAHYRRLLAERAASRGRRWKSPTPARTRT